jgi:hypothetical protein
MVVGAVAAVAVLVHGPRQPSAAPAKNAPRAQIVSQSTYVSPADRRAIDRTLDRFIPAGLDRSKPKTAWNLSGPGLRGGSTLRQWQSGTSPIPYYPARGKTFHSWKTIDAGPGYVDFNILIHPRRGAKESSWVFSGQMVKRNGRWLVNGLYTIAIMAKPDKNGRHEIGPDDFAAGPAIQNNQQGQGGPQPNGRATLGTKWLLVAGGVILLAILFPVGLGVASAFRARRVRRAYAAASPRELPPLPRRVSQPSEPVGSGRNR